jgi:hypothetical protein
VQTMPAHRGAVARESIVRVSTDQPKRIRFRPHGAIAIAALVALLGAVPLASAGWQYLPVLLVPVVIVAWALRAGTDAGPEGLRVRALIGQRRIAWSEVSELGADRRGRVLARLTSGQVVPLTSVRDRDLPRLVEVSNPPSPG